MPIINSGTGFYIGRRFDIQLSAELRHKGDPIFERYFDGNSTSAIDFENNAILIPNHFFRTGENLTYEYENFFNNSNAAVGVATTTIPGVGVSITKLPQNLYAVVLNDRFIQLAATKDRALKRIPEVFDLTSTGFGTFHKFVGEKQNTRSLIAVDNVIQTPAIDTETRTTLLEDLSAGSDLLVVAGITSFFTGDLIRINNEIMRINLVGVGNTTSFIVRRPMLGTGLSPHLAGDDVVKVAGNYQIVDNIIYFPVAPFEKSPTTDLERKNPLDRDYVGIETFSTFDGRVFLRSGFEDTSFGPYDKNYLLDDISNQFLGISTQAVLKQQGQNVSGFSTGNALILINNVFQTPDFIDYGLRESSGITTISFTGEGNSNPEDINTASIPRGGIIVSVGTKEGYGYQPLVAAGGTAKVSNSGTIESVSVGYTGSGYRAAETYKLKTRITHPTYNPAVVPAGGFSNRFFLKDEDGLFTKLNYFLNGNPSAKCILSVKDSVGINFSEDNEYSRIVSVGNTYVIINSALDAWSEIFDSSSYNFLYSTNATQASGISTNKIKVLNISDPRTGVGIDTSSEDFYLTLGSVATNEKIISVDSVNKIFTIENPTSGPYVVNSGVTIKTFTAGVTQTNIDDIAYITVTEPNVGVVDVFVNVDKQYLATSADYTNTTGIVTITTPGMDVSKGEIVDLRGFVYSCKSGGSFESSEGSFNLRVGISSITVNSKAFTVTNATYDPLSGISTLTIGSHSLLTGDRIFIEPESLGFTCTLDGNSTTTYYPRPGDPAYNKTLEILGTTATTIRVNVGSTNDASVHTVSNAPFVNAVRYSTGIATITSDDDVPNTLNPGDLVLFNNTNSFLDENIFTVQSSPISFDSSVNAFTINVDEIFVPSPASNLLDSPGSFVLATIVLPSGKFGYEFEVLETLDNNTFILDVGEAPLNHTYVGGGLVKNVTRSKNPIHIGVSSIKDGHVTNVEITNSGIGFTQYNLYATYNLSAIGNNGSQVLNLGNVSGINTYKDYISISNDVNLVKVIGVNESLNQITIQTPLPSVKSIFSPVNFYRYDDFNLNFEDPLSYQNINLVYSANSVQGIGSYAKANVTVGNDGKVKEFELLSSGYSYGQGEILTLPVGGPTDIPIFETNKISGISTAIGIFTGSIVSNGDRFGFSVGINSDGSSMVVGSPFGEGEILNSSGIGTASGVVYVFDRNGNNFSQVGILTGSYAYNLNDNFGHSVAISGDGNLIFVGAPNDLNPNVGVQSGQVYIFERSAGPTFNQVGILSGSRSTNASYFGWDVDITPDASYLVVGARRDQIANFSRAGAVYVYEKDPGPSISYSEFAVLEGSNGSIEDNFGYSVAISPDGNYIAVGALFDEDTGNITDNFGIVYVYEKSGITVNQVGILTSPKLNTLKNEDNFGYSVDISRDGNIIVVGAKDDTSIIGGESTGLVYIFEKISNQYYPIQVLKGTYSTNSGDDFGSSLALSEDGSIIVIGAINDENTGIGMPQSSGLTYVYERRTFNYLGSDYVNVGIQTGVYSNNLNDNYGTSVAISGDKNSFIVGAQYDELTSTGIGTSGAAYVYDLSIGSTFEEFEVLIDQTFTDSFSGYVFGDLVVFDDISRLFNGKRKEFPFRLGGVQTTLRSRPGSTLELEYNLLIFINDIYQVPNQSYIFGGGSTFTFTEAPNTGDKCVIVFYYGTTAVDTRLVDILETIKIGDNVTVNSQDFSLQQNSRTVTDIRSTDIIETNSYSFPGVTGDNTLQRPVKWCKQLVDKVIDGNVVGKSRKPYEPEIYPKSQIIKGVGIGSTESIFVESLKTFFDSDDEYENVGINKAPQDDIIIISNDVGIAGSASVTVGSNLRISNIVLNYSGYGYSEAPDVSISNPTFVGIGTTFNQRAEASCTIDSLGRINSITLTNPGYGYTNSGPSPIVFIGPPKVKYEVIEDVFYEGDFGWITGIGTTSGNRQPISQIGIVTGTYAFQQNDYYGCRIASSSDASTFIVGAYRDEFSGNDPNLDSGVAYVYDRSGSTISQVGILTGTFASDGSDYYGWSVAMSGDGNTIAVAAIQDETNDIASINDGGVIYVYKRVGGSFVGISTLIGSQTTGSLQVSWSLKMSGDGNTLIAGCKFAGNPAASGIAYIFKRQTNDSFIETQVLSGSLSNQTLDYFGESVDINEDGSIIVIGSINAGDESPVEDNSGRVYVYRLSGSVYQQTDVLKPDSLLDSGDFGSSVAIANKTGTIVVGAVNGELSGNNPSSGVAYIYDQDLNGSYKFIEKISGLFATDVNDYFGSSVDISSNGRTVVVGAYQDETAQTTSNVGTVYVFNRAGNSFSTVGILTGGYSSQSSDGFGRFVTISEDGKYIIVGAERDEDPNSESESGVAYVFENPTPDVFEKNFVFELYITEDSYLRDSTTGTPRTESQIQPGYYFRVTKSNIGFGTEIGIGITSVDVYDGTKRLFNGDKFLDGVYQTSSVSIARTEVPGLTVGFGRTDIVRVIVPVESYNGLDVPSGGSIGKVGSGYTFGQYFGEFSWGKMSNLKRTKLLSFDSYNNGDIGISTSPTIIRINPLKSEGYTPNS